MGLKYFAYKPEDVVDVYFGVRCPKELSYAVMKLIDNLPADFSKMMELKYDPLRLEA